MARNKAEIQEKADYIQRFISCSYAPLDEVGTENDKKFWADEFTSLGFKLWDSWSFTRTGKLRTKDWERIKEVKQEVLDALKWFVDNFQAESDLYINAPFMLTTLQGSYNFSYDGHWLEHEIVGLKIKTGETEKKKSVSYGFFKFLESLSGFGYFSLLRCPKCEKIFFNPTKREMKYCSARCRNAAAIKRFREKQE